jgi:hypothetical protein
MKINFRRVLIQSVQGRSFFLLCGLFKNTLLRLPDNETPRCCEGMNFGCEYKRQPFVKKGDSIPIHLFDRHT